MAQTKEPSIEILQITAGGDPTQVLGLGGDGLIYCWSNTDHNWFLWTS